MGVAVLLRVGLAEGFSVRGGSVPGDAESPCVAVREVSPPRPMSSLSAALCSSVHGVEDHTPLTGWLGSFESLASVVMPGRLSVNVGRLPWKRLGVSRMGFLIVEGPAWRVGGALRGTVDRSLGVEGSPAALLDDSSSAACLLGGILEFRTLDYDIKEISQ